MGILDLVGYVFPIVIGMCGFVLVIAVIYLLTLGGGVKSLTPPEWKGILPGDSPRSPTPQRPSYRCSTCGYVSPLRAPEEAWHDVMWHHEHAH